MKKQSNFSLFNYIKNNKHVLLLLYYPIYLPIFAYLNSGLQRNYHIIELPIDRMIPFCEWFVIPYVVWYLYIFAAPVYLLLKDKFEFKRFMYMLIVSFSFSLLMFTFYPTGQMLRPEAAPNNIAGFICSIIWAADPPYNVLPSMHVLGTLFSCVSITLTPTIKSKLFKICYNIMGVLIIMSTCFIKQHSVIDTVFAIIVFIPILISAKWVVKNK